MTPDTRDSILVAICLLAFVAVIVMATEPVGNRTEMQTEEME